VCEVKRGPKLIGGACRARLLEDRRRGERGPFTSPAGWKDLGDEDRSSGRRFPQNRGRSTGHRPAHERNSRRTPLREVRVAAPDRISSMARRASSSSSRSAVHSSQSRKNWSQFCVPAFISRKSRSVDLRSETLVIGSDVLISVTNVSNVVSVTASNASPAKRGGCNQHSTNGA
jgi:hypothetical protein